MVPAEDALAVADAREDKARRSRTALVLGVAVVIALFLVRQPNLAGLPGFGWSTSVMLPRCASSSLSAPAGRGLG